VREALVTDWDQAAPALPAAISATTDATVIFLTVHRIADAASAVNIFFIAVSLLLMSKVRSAVAATPNDSHVIRA
jgi:hypothetical protein